MKVFARLTVALLSSAALASCAGTVQDTNTAARNSQPPRSSCVNLNTAPTAELESLPAIGPALAGKIVEHREMYGPFKRPEEVIIIDGFSEQRYRQLSGLVCVN